MKKQIAIACATALALTIAGCASTGDLDGSTSTEESTTITVGSANFSESVLLAHIYSEALKDAGYETAVKPNIGSREVLIPALEDGSIDLVPEYSGSLLSYLDKDAVAFSSEDVIKALGEAVPEGTELLEASPAEDKDAFVVTAETAAKYQLTSLADLQPVAGELVLGGPPETQERRTGIPGLKEVYDVTFASFVPLDLGGPLTIAGLKAGDIDVARMFTTQAAIAENGFVVLEDPNSLVSAENIVPLIRASKNSAEVAQVLNAVSAKLTTEDLIAMNQEIEISKKEPQQVARAYLDGMK